MKCCVLSLSIASALLALPAAAQTTIAVTGNVLHKAPLPLGINLDDHTFYDAGQLMKNLVMRNPGFEGMHYQTVMRCAAVTANTCASDNPYAVFPANYWNGATVEVATGTAAGKTSTVLSSSKPDGSKNGANLTFAAPLPLKTGNYIILRKDTASTLLADGNIAGWWKSGNAVFAAETADLSPKTPGKQALRVTGDGTLTQYFDSTDGMSFLRMRGPYRLTFRVKRITPFGSLNVSLSRSSGIRLIPGNDIRLTSGWQEISIPFTAREPAANTKLGTATLSFSFSSGSFLIDDVALEEAGNTADNPTVFRDAVVTNLRAIRPGVLRFMASNTALGSTIPNLLAPPMARLRSGYSGRYTAQEDIPYGIDDFLLLCKTIGAEPWLTLPGAMSTAEAPILITHLQQKWAGQFPKIHLELGNEMWNSDFDGQAMVYPEAQGQRTAAIFAAIRSTPGYNAAAFDLIIGGQAAGAGRNSFMLDSAKTGADTLAIAPYMANEPNFFPTDDWAGNHYLSLIGEAQQMITPNGWIGANAAIAKAHNMAIASYETNLSPLNGKANQTQMTNVSSLGAGLAIASQMLLAMRDLNLRNQCFFTLSQYQFGRHDGLRLSLWGGLLDHDGPTNRWRPQLLALALANTAIHGDQLQANITGNQPTFSIDKGDDNITLNNGQYLQAFAFGDASAHHLIVLNLDPAKPLTIQIADPAFANAEASAQQLTAGNVVDTNETAQNVTVHPIPNQQLNTPIILPPHSLTAFDWPAKNTPTGKRR